MFQSLAAMSSSRGSLKTSSHASHGVTRGAAKLAVDVMGVSDDTKLMRVKGQTYVTLSSELGDAKYDRLCSTPGLRLLTINYCQRALSDREASTWASIVTLSRDPASTSAPSQVLQSQAPAAEDIKKLKGLINHDYLVLEIQPGDPSQPIFYIVAQKLNGDKPGIHIDPIFLEKKGEVLHKDVLHYSVNCKKKQIQLESIIKILKKGSPDYSLRDANCWDYATSTAKRLLKECANVPGNRPDEKARLKMEQNDLEANLASRHLSSTIKLLKEKAPQLLKSR